MTISEALVRTKAYLNSTEALQSIERDPYWPKWNSPWWHICLLYEMDLAKEIPQAALLKMVQVLKNHYLPVFPIKEEDVPIGTDPYRRIAWLCAVGNMYQVQPWWRLCSTLQASSHGGAQTKSRVVRT